MQDRDLPTPEQQIAQLQGRIAALEVMVPMIVSYFCEPESDTRDAITTALGEVPRKMDFSSTLQREFRQGFLASFHEVLKQLLPAP